MLAALTGAPVEECCGRGTGLDDEGVRRKAKVIRLALTRHTESVGEGAGARAVLGSLGGIEIAAMVGAFLRAPAVRCVAVVDGFIASVAALCAVRIDPACRKSMVFATRSAERGSAIVCEALDASPALDMGLRLGEGSGAALALPMLRAAANLMDEMLTLDEALALG